MMRRTSFAFASLFAGLSLTGCSAAHASGDPDLDGPETELRRSPDDGQRVLPLSLSCTLLKVHDSNVFEESLSLEEYPDISINVVAGKLVLDIGASSYDGTDGESIVLASRSGNDVDITINAPRRYSYRVRVTAKKGVIETTANDRTSKVADFTCE